MLSWYKVFLLMQVDNLEKKFLLRMKEVEKILKGSKIQIISGDIPKNPNDKSGKIVTEYFYKGESIMSNYDIIEVNENIINGLSILIIKHLNNAAFQQYTPESDPDKSDAMIADATEKVEKLRKIRQEFEDVVTGIVAPF